MANMSYCRFRNTALDFADCVYALSSMLDDIYNNNDISEWNEVNGLSHSEEAAMERLYKLATEFIQLYDEASEELECRNM